MIDLVRSSHTYRSDWLMRVYVGTAGVLVFLLSARSLETVLY